MEDYTKEFKIDIPQKQKALKAEIVSFLNSTNGEIYLGEYKQTQSDKHTVRSH